MAKGRSPAQTERPLQAATDGNVTWTVMVFMGADTESGNAPMLDVAVSDLLEMALVGSGGPLEVFVQIHGRGEVRRDKIQRKMLKGLAERGLASLPLVDEKEGNHADGKALERFLTSVFRTSSYRLTDPLHHTLLVLWGHAYDFAIGKAPTRQGTIDALDFVELSSTLNSLQWELKNQLGTTELPKLDVIAFDACDVATVELACELYPYANYLLGSQIGVPIPGWPYDRILERLRLPFGRGMSPAELGSWVVNRFCEAYTPLRAVSLSMLDLGRAEELFARAQVLADTLLIAIGRDPEMQKVLTEIFSRSLTDLDKPFVDVGDLCLSLARESGDPHVTAAARALGDFLIAPPLDVVDQSASSRGRPFVTAHGRNAGETAKLNGINLYAPSVAPDNEFMAVRALYDKFRFANVTRWSSLVHGLAT